MDEKNNVQYANAISMSYSPFETRLEFYLESPTGEGEVEKNKIADIRLSPIIAKELCDIVKNCIDDYETKIGAIPTVKQEQGV